MKQARIAESIAVAVRRDLAQVIAELPAIPEHVLAGRCPTVAEAQAAIAAPSRPVGRPMPDPASPARRTFNRANSAAGGRTHRRIHRFNQMSSANHLQ